MRSTACCKAWVISRADAFYIVIAWQFTMPTATDSYRPINKIGEIGRIEGILSEPVLWLGKQTTDKEIIRAAKGG